MSPGNLEALNTGTLADILDRILDKGVVINADITVSLVGVELLGLQIRLALASFETAARYGPSSRAARTWRRLPGRNCGRPATDRVTRPSISWP